MCNYFKAVYKWFEQIWYLRNTSNSCKSTHGPRQLFFPVNKEEEEEEEDKNKQEEDEIKTTMQY